MFQFDSIDPSLIPNLFLIFQVGTIGIFVIWHFLMGIKRGVTKTLWFFVGNVILILGVFYLVGRIQLSEFLNEETLRRVVSLIPFNQSEINEYLDKVIDSGGLPLLLAILDLVIKILFFTLFLFVFKFIFHLIFLRIPWIFIKRLVKDQKKNRIVGGLIGIFRGAFTGFIMIFPMLILINTIVDDGLLIDIPEYNELALGVNQANEYNVVKYMNEIKVRNRGSADFIFDLAFRSQVKGGDLIIWRDELSWSSKLAQQALPYLMGDDHEVVITYDELLKFESLIDKMTNSNLLDEGFKVGLKVGLSLSDNFTDQLNFLSEDDLNYFIDKVDSMPISLTKDLKTIFNTALDLLEVKTFDEWMELVNKPGDIANLSEDEINVLLDSLSSVFNLDILKLSDTVLTLALKHDLVKSNFKWIDDENDKLAYITNLQTKLKTYNDKFVIDALGDITALLKGVYNDFPGIDLDGDGEADVTLTEFINNLTTLTIVLNDDPNYHLFVKETLSDLTSLNIFDFALEPLIDYGTYFAMNTEVGWDSQEKTDFLEIVSNNFSSQEDLTREILWISDVYEGIAGLHIATNLQTNTHPAIILDELLTTHEGQDKFFDFIGVILDGQTISALTNQMSYVLVNKYLTEPANLKIPLERALLLDGFNFKDEINEALSILFNLYDTGLLLQDIMRENADLVKELTPILLDFIKDEDNKDALLNSNIFYSLIDYNLTTLEQIDIPPTAINDSGKYEGWIKKSELSTLFDIAVDVLEEMDNAGIEINDLMNNPNAFNEVFPAIKSYIGDEDNKDKLLSSEIIYSLLSTQLKGLEAIEIPETALVNDSNSPYNEWIIRDEIDKLLSSIVILDLNLPDSGNDFDLSNITGVELNEVINLESKIITRLITTQLNNANLFDIPEGAYTSPEKLDLKQNELSAIGDMLVTLDLDLGVLSDSNNNEFLDDILVEDLLELKYEESLVIRGFISYGITDGFNDIHELAYDIDEPSLLSIHELDELFKVLDALDSDPSMSLTELMDDLNPNELTVSKTNLAITSGDSIVLRGEISKELLENNEIKDQNLKDNAFHHENSIKYDDLISYDELLKLIDAFISLSDSPDDLILDVTDNLAPDKLTLLDTSNVIDKESSIIKTVISKSIIDFEDFKIHPEALELADEIYQDQLELFINSLIAGFGESKKLDQIADDVQSDLTINTINDMRAVNSLIFEGQISDVIRSTIEENYPVRDNAYFDANDPVLGKAEFGLLDKDEITNFLNSLDALDNHQGSPLNTLIDNMDANQITTYKLIKVNEEESILIQTILSNIIIPTVDHNRISVNAYDSINTEDLSHQELTNLFNAISVLDDSYNPSDPNAGDSLDNILSDLGNNSDSLTLNKMYQMNDKNSYIIRKYMSEGIVNSLGLSTIREDAFSEVSLELILKDEINNLLNALNKVADKETTPPDDPNEMSLITLTNNIDSTSLTPELLKEIVNQESVIMNRKITYTITNESSKEILGTNILVPDSALETHSYPGHDITKVELINLSDALIALGFSTLELDNLNPGDIELEYVGSALEEESAITNRLISDSINNVNLDTLESHLGTEDETIDIQVEEMINLVNAFIALGIEDINDAQNINEAELFTNAQSINQEEFKEYIGYETPLPNEDEGMTIVKDFMIDKLHNPPLTQVETRQELLDLIYP
ncbi:MAG: hypothetical protein WC907_01715 [Acholeplasmataceae bacterium]